MVAASLLRERHSQSTIHTANKIDSLLSKNNTNSIDSVLQKDKQARLLIPGNAR